MSILKDTKLKGPIGRVYPIAIFFLYFLILIEVIITGYKFPVYSSWLFGAMFMIVGAMQFLRSGLWVHLALGILIGTCTWHSMAVYKTEIFSAASYLIHFMLLVMFIVFTWSLLFGHDKFESNARRLFKLASESIVEVSAGYTDRPYSAGKSSISNDDLIGFARFMKNRRIAMPHHSEQGLYLMFSMGRSVLTHPEPNALSYVLFGRSGDLSIHVSEFDYKQYKQKVTFDQLCNSLAKVFNRFSEYYVNGNEGRIVDELKEV